MRLEGNLPAPADITILAHKMEYPVRERDAGGQWIKLLSDCSVGLAGVRLFYRENVARGRSTFPCQSSRAVRHLLQFSKGAVKPL